MSSCISFAEYNKAIRNYTRFDDWYLWVQMYKGTVSMPVFQSLEAYWPGLQVGMIREVAIFLWNWQSKLILRYKSNKVLQLLEYLFSKGGVERQERLRVNETNFRFCQAEFSKGSVKVSGTELPICCEMLYYLKWRVSFQAVW